MKSVLISIQPRWCELIAKKKKTVEVRKTRPKINTPFKCYIYCTKPPKGKSHTYDAFGFGGNPYDYGGKVIGEFICKSIYHYRYTKPFPYLGMKMHHTNAYCAQACLSWPNLEKYLGASDGYGWHINDLVIYNKPKELYEFLNYSKYEACLKRACFSSDCLVCPNNAIIIKAPQTWCYIEEDK